MSVPRHASNMSLLGLNDRRDVVELATVHHQTASYEVYWPFRHHLYHEVGIGIGNVATSINDSGEIAGWYLSGFGPIFAFTVNHGVWTSYRRAKPRRGRTNVTEILGLNNGGSAVGFYSGDDGTDRAFELDSATGKFYVIRPPDAVSAEATGVSNRGDVAGFMTQNSGRVESFC